MKVNTTIRQTSASRYFSCSACRLRRSQDKASLTDEALTQRVQQSLGDNVKLDTASKAVKSEYGSLPISPILDPAWVKTHERAKKPGIDTSQALTSFRKRFLSTHYAMALATPMRTCSITRIALPRYFLQDWEIIQHPETQEDWFAPGPASFRHVQRTIRPHEESDVQATEQQHDAPGAEEAGVGATAEVTASTRTRAAPLTAYTLCSARLVDTISKKRMGPKILSGRSGMALKDSVRGATWRPDMGDVVLRMMRRSATDALVTRSTREREPVYKFVRPCGSWEELARVNRRMAVLWLPPPRQSGEDEVAKNNTTAGSRYATYDREGAGRFDRKLAVHNLRWLLGEEEVERLREESEMFRNHELFMLQAWRSKSMHSLHLLLWKLQGYLDRDWV